MSTFFLRALRQCAQPVLTPYDEWLAQWRLRHTERCARRAHAAWVAHGRRDRAGQALAVRALLLEVRLNSLRRSHRQPPLWAHYGTWTLADGRHDGPDGTRLTEAQYWGRVRGYVHSYPELRTQLQAIDEALLHDGCTPLPVPAEA